MKAPRDLDEDMRTVLEIVQHCGEILSRLPLAALRQHLARRLEDHRDRWHAEAAAMMRTAEAFELASAELSAEEARNTPVIRAEDLYPDDALPSQ